MNTRRAPKAKTNPFDDDDHANSRGKPSSYSDDEGGNSSAESFFGYSSAKSRYKNDFRDSGGIQNQSVQELEGYVVYKAEETTQTVNGCLKIAEDIRETASTTLVELHKQGQQIERTHQTAVDMDYSLSRSEQLLGNLGGIFSKKWKPKKTHEIKGPVLSKDDSFIRRGSHLEQRQKLGIQAPPPRSERRTLPEPTSAIEKVEVEKAKQDAALDDLSNVLGDLKSMAVDMGQEIDRQTVALGGMETDIDELNFRVKGANARARRLVGR